MKNKTRRKFILKISKIITVVFGMAVVGRYLVFPQTSEAANIQFKESSYGNKKKSDSKILVAYESQFGSTVEVADVIGKALSEDGKVVDIKKIKDIEDLSIYNSIVIGSAIQYDKWMSEARIFVKSNETTLNKLPVAYFFTCLTLAEKSEKANRKANKYADKLNQLSALVNPISIGRFAGVLDYSKMSSFSRIMAKGLFAILGVKEGDYRDWDAIRLWAKSVDFK